MAANIWRTRLRLSATACGLDNSWSSQAADADAGAGCWAESGIADNLRVAQAFLPVSPQRGERFGSATRLRQECLSHRDALADREVCCCCTSHGRLVTYV